MSIQVRNQTSGVLERVAGFNDTDSILSPNSKNPISNKAVYNALLQKIDKTVTDLINYYDKSQVYTKSEVRALIGSINTLTIEVVSQLPTSEISTTTIYFVGPKTGTNNYDEYVYVSGNWVQIGDTTIDLTDYITSSQLTTILQDYYTKNAVDALLDNYYTKTNVDNLLDDKQDILTFDNTPTAGSNNPVTSAGIKTALDTKQNSLTFDNVPTENSANVVKSGGIYSVVDDVYRVMTNNGAKNLLPNNATSQTIGGVTFTVNTDGSVTANGTSTTGIAFVLELTFELKKGSYILSDGVKHQKYYAAVRKNNVVIARGRDEGKFTLSEDSTLYCEIWVTGGNTLTNVTFKPMIRLASDTDDTYQPYAMTNRELTEKVSIELTKSDQNSSLNQNSSFVRGKLVEFNFNISNTTFTVNSWNTIVTFSTQYAPSALLQFPCIIDDNNGNNMALALLRVTTDGRIEVRPNSATQKCVRVGITYVR